MPQSNRDEAVLDPRYNVATTPVLSAKASV